MPCFFVITQTDASINVSRETADTPQAAALQVANKARKPCHCYAVDVIAAAKRDGLGYADPMQDVVGPHIRSLAYAMANKARRAGIAVPQPTQQTVPGLISDVIEPYVNDLRLVVRLAARAIEKEPDAFRFRFVTWLVDNWETWTAFYQMARHHQIHHPTTPAGAKEFAERLRWSGSGIRDSAGTFKVNNNYVAPMAALYNAATRTSFFKVRRRTAT